MEIERLLILTITASIFISAIISFAFLAFKQLNIIEDNKETKKNYELSESLEAIINRIITVVIVGTITILSAIYFSRPCEPCKCPSEREVIEKVLRDSKQNTF